MSADFDEKIEETKGPVAWMAKNSVASNLFMFILLFAGAVSLMRTKQEVLPEFNLDMIVVAVPYPGAAPAEVEQGIILALEEAVQGVEGVKRLKSTAAENSGSMLIELNKGVNASKVLNEVKASIDRISTFPENAEEPQVTELTLRKQVITLILSGPQELSAL
jgi:multidrug efflux pump subunit AcrB